MKQHNDINTLITLANQGDTSAKRRLAVCYFYGCDGVEQNYEEAAKCFEAANDKEMLGECYLHALGVERNIEKTIKLWEAACEERCRYYAVMFKLAHLYGDGVEMEPNYEKALYWWYQLAENDGGEFGQDGAFAEAIYQLACYYYEGKGVKKNLKQALKYFRYTIDLFFQRDPENAFYIKYDRALHVIKFHDCNIEGDITISDEPDFIIHARKVLIKHGHKSIINKTKKAAQNGDKKAAEILNEFGIEFIVPTQTEPVRAEVQAEAIVKEEPKREPPVMVCVGDVLTHKTFGDGIVCEVDGYYLCVEFVSVGKKRFLNPEAFNNGFLKDAKLT